MDNKPKDPMTKFRSVNVGKNSKGGDRYQLTLGGDSQNGNAEIEQLIETLTALKDSPRGVKLDIHISDKEYEGRKFKSAIAFVRAVQEMGANGGGRGPAPTRFVPKTAGTGAGDVAARLKAQQIK